MKRVKYVRRNVAGKRYKKYRSRHMRMAKYHGILCRSILHKKRSRNLKYRLSSNFYWDSVIPSMFPESSSDSRYYKEYEARTSDYIRNAVTVDNVRNVSLAGLILRVYNVRTRRFRIGRRFLFRSTIDTPMSYVPHYVYSASTLFGAVSNHYTNVNTTLLSALASDCSSLRAFLILFYSSVSFLGSTVHCRLSGYLLDFRHAYFSMCGIGGSFYIQNRDKYTYFTLLKDNNFLVKNTTGNLGVLDSTMCNSRSFI